MKKDITDTIEAVAAIYPDGEVAGIYAKEFLAERAHRGEQVRLVYLVPASPVIVEVE